MNKQNFNQSVGFPFETENLAEMQNAYSLFNSFGHLSGNLTIISGCDVTGTTCTDGTVFINGELLPFKGGNISTTVIIKENVTEREFKDGTNKPVFFERYATFGIGTTVYNWVDFKKGINIVELLNRLEKLEKRPVSNVPVGMIAIWDRPANEIPAGWIEYVPLKGRMPIGHDEAYDSNTNGDLKNYNLNQLGYAGGVREHKLILDEIPAHNHSPGGDSSFLAHGYDGVGTGGGLGFSGIASQGKDRPHNNMSPYRVVKFIQYKGI